MEANNIGELQAQLAATSAVKMQTWTPARLSSYAKRSDRVKNVADIVFIATLVGRVLGVKKTGRFVLLSWVASWAVSIEQTAVLDEVDRRTNLAKTATTDPIRRRQPGTRTPAESKQTLRDTLVTLSQSTSSPAAAALLGLALKPLGDIGETVLRSAVDGIEDDGQRALVVDMLTKQGLLKPPAPTDEPVTG